MVRCRSMENVRGRGHRAGLRHRPDQTTAVHAALDEPRREPISSPRRRQRVRPVTRSPPPRPPHIHDEQNQHLSVYITDAGTLSLDQPRMPQIPAPVGSCLAWWSSGRHFPAAASETAVTIPTILIMQAMRTAIRLHATPGLAADSPTVLRVEAFLAALVEDAVAQLPHGTLPADCAKRRPRAKPSVPACDSGGPGYATGSGPGLATAMERSPAAHPAHAIHERPQCGAVARSTVTFSASAPM